MIDKLLEFYSQAAKLKRVKRAGWQRCGVGECESVAEHSFGVALLAFVLLPKHPGFRVDRDRCVAMALVHDLAEAIVGDITPQDGVAAEEKHARERTAMEKLAKMLDDEELLMLWDEFEAGESGEAKLIRELDVIEMAWQAKDYEREGRLTARASEGFANSALGRVKSGFAMELLDVITRS